MDTTPASDAALARGILEEKSAGQIVLALPGTDYRLHLATDGPVAARPGQRIAGRIVARARRVDVVGVGGRFIEPVYGRPRRLQGAVLALDVGANAITVQAGCPFVCTLAADQKASEFAAGQLVAFDVERGAKFEIGSGI